MLVNNFQVVSILQRKNNQQAKPAQAKLGNLLALLFNFGHCFGHTTFANSLCVSSHSRGGEFFFYLFFNFEAIAQRETCCRSLPTRSARHPAAARLTAESGCDAQSRKSGAWSSSTAISAPVLAPLATSPMSRAMMAWHSSSTGSKKGSTALLVAYSNTAAT